MFNNLFELFRSVVYKLNNLIYFYIERVIILKWIISIKKKSKRDIAPYEVWAKLGPIDLGLAREVRSLNHNVLTGEIPSSNLIQASHCDWLLNLNF